MFFINRTFCYPEPSSVFCIVSGFNSSKSIAIAQTTEPTTILTFTLYIMMVSISSIVSRMKLEGEEDEQYKYQTVDQLSMCWFDPLRAVKCLDPSIFACHLIFGLKDRPPLSFTLTGFKPPQLSSGRLSSNQQFVNTRLFVI